MDKTPYRAIFFDLDGTLLPMDLEAFMQSYFNRLSGFVAAQGLDTQEFSAALKAGITAMATHGGERSNAQAYWDAFFSVADRGAADWESALEYFYEHEFGRIGEGVVPDCNAHSVLEVLVGKGYPLVLATMPMFPVRAVEWRLSWAGIDSASFSRVTHFENSTSVKPKLDYFAENLAACGCASQEVLMVGNNTKEDLACLDLAMDAYLVTDHLLDPIGFDLARVKHGTLADLAVWAEGLPQCESPAYGIEAGRVPRGGAPVVPGAAAMCAPDANPQAEA